MIRVKPVSRARLAMQDAMETQAAHVGRCGTCDADLVVQCATGRRLALEATTALAVYRHAAGEPPLESYA